ncbi:MAG: DUF1553 domain-containing protein [Pirellula sp.]
MQTRRSIREADLKSRRFTLRKLSLELWSVGRSCRVRLPRLGVMLIEGSPIEYRARQVRPASTQYSAFASICVVACWLILSLMGQRSLAEEPQSIAFFEQKIRPVLIEHCYACHSANASKLKGNLLLDTKAGWEKGGDSGNAVIVPGSPELSLLIRFVKHDESGLEMPPNKPKLADSVIADLVTWVRMGAPDPRDGRVEAKRADKSWWSLQRIATKFVQSNIDGFIADKLRDNGLTFNPPADPRSLVRRMYYDLTGLPPSKDDVDAFLTAHRTDAKLAVQALVDTLLASPHYGERWGRHWLDVVRFGESNGFERNFIIDDLWPFRDYVIKSFNDDKPFDQFIIEHLAGDVIGKDDPKVEVGSAFLVAGPFDDVGNQSVEAQKNIRAATLDEIVTASASAFLGLTVNCARCHHHKFDPIPTQDYYRMRAAFEGVTHGRRTIASVDERTETENTAKPLRKELASLAKERDAIEDSLNERARASLAESKYTRPKIDVYGTHESFEPVLARYVKFEIRASTSDFQQAKGKLSSNPNSSRLTEFQVWSAEQVPRNVALASNGAIAHGAKSQTAEDYPEAYGPQFCIDGQYGEQWFVGNPSVLTLTLPKPETIGKITFINARGGREVDESKVRGATPCEYDIQVSLDGISWRTVASNDGREPWSTGHAIANARRDLMVSDEDSQRLASLAKQIAQIQQRLDAIPPLRQVWAGTFSQPKEPTRVHIGGDPMKNGDLITPSSLSVLDHATTRFELAEDAPESERRLALARWIVSPENPLTARVLANRVWQYHFGTGIVDTPSDFGFLGSRPTHPELIDYLANRLIANQWKLKLLHREILLSQTYQQSSRWSETAGTQDKDARWLWRFPPRRLSAEEIRDTMLNAAGVLKLDPMGGPGFRLYKVAQNNVSTYFPLDSHGPESFRRSVYHQNARASVVDILNDFDLPDIAFAAPKRANTTSPAQSLTMLNHNFTFEMAQRMADRCAKSDPVRAAYVIAFQREPTQDERSAAEALVAKHGAVSLCRALLNSNELLYLE